MEEDAGDPTKVIPFLVGDMLRGSDGNYSKGAVWALLC